MRTAESLASRPDWRTVEHPHVGALELRCGLCGGLIDDPVHGAAAVFGGVLHRPPIWYDIINGGLGP